MRLRNAYVIKAERVEKDAEGNITTIFCTYDADTLSKDPADGRKVKGVIHWVSAAHALPVEIRLYDRLFSVFSNTPSVAMAASVLLLMPGFPLINAVADMFKGQQASGRGGYRTWRLARTTHPDADQRRGREYHTYAGWAIRRGQ